MRGRATASADVKDLSETPMPAPKVTLTLTAKDEAACRRSEPFTLRLPERLFTKPCARLIEHAPHSGARATRIRRSITALDALMIAPGLFTPEAGHYLAFQRGAPARRAAPHRRAFARCRCQPWALWHHRGRHITDVDKACARHRTR